MVIAFNKVQDMKDEYVLEYCAADSVIL
uniref:Uncharacterized protein n=1 Tax=Anguilla anguilla TaxID=7936 RepID=A0A0E9SIS7_ANGAN